MEVRIKNYIERKNGIMEWPFSASVDISLLRIRVRVYLRAQSAKVRFEWRTTKFWDIFGDLQDSGTR